MTLRCAVAAVLMPGGAMPVPAGSDPISPQGRGQLPQRAATPDHLGKQFARLLCKQEALDDKAAGPATTAADAAASAFATMPRADLAFLPSSQATPTLSAGADPAARACAVAAAAQAQAPSSTAPTVVTAVDAGNVWELSLNTPDGLALSLRAERIAAPQPAGGAPAAWALTVGAPGAETAAALRHHAPRLAERLAARALTPAHLRIDERGERPPHTD
ncbi:hypothetical protein [Aquabacterium humicola]|uniref:hypothetical protein n=1 Tax=Aquabacterium humicola TaxID=3237377 RepID=UPI00254368A8|nr:hypothetical protein [Rubrivivax pictus]